MQRLFGMQVFALGQAAIQWSSDALGGGIRRDQFGEFFLQTDELLFQAVAYVFRNLTLVFGEIGTVESPDFCFQLFDAFFGGDCVHGGHCTIPVPQFLLELAAKPADDAELRRAL